MATARNALRPGATYEGDFYTWLIEQAALVRDRRLDALDVENVAEELEGLARAQVSELRSRYTTLLLHLLKWEFQPSKRTSSWVGTIIRERGEINEHLQDNPSLKPRRMELFARAYESARLGASIETRLPTRVFPKANPYALGQAMHRDFWPGEPRVGDEPDE